MYKIYDNNLIGYEHTGETEFSLYGTDNESNFNSIKLKQPSDWYYLHNKVIYIRNSNGHRSIEPEQLPDDYILFAGCSLTEGIGVKSEHSYAHLVAEHFNMGMYNLALNGAGPDLVVHNIGTWYSLYKKPKYVVIQWPGTHRVFYKESGHIFPMGPWSCKPNTKDAISNNAWNAYEAMISTEFFEHYTMIFKNTIRPLLESAGTKVYQFSSDDINITDYGRDLKHPGIESHRLLANKIIQYLKD